MPEPTDDLIAWLRAQLDDDEHVALAAGGENWPDSAHEMWTNELVHARRHDPARVLRQVERDRRLLEQFRLRGNSVRATVQPSTGGVWDDLLRMLALPYADRPGYRQEWRP